MNGNIILMQGRSSQIPMFVLSTSLRLVNLVKTVDTQYGLTETLINKLRGLLGGREFLIVISTTILSVMPMPR